MCILSMSPLINLVQVIFMSVAVLSFMGAKFLLTYGISSTALIQNPGTYAQDPETSPSCPALTPATPLATPKSQRMFPEVPLSHSSANNPLS